MQCRDLEQNLKQIFNDHTIGSPGCRQNNPLKLNMKTTIETNRIRSATLFTNSRSRNRSNQAVTANVTNLRAPDLTQRPPRSPRSRLGSYSLLPRMIDKGRATLAGTNGEYHFDCPLDKRILSFVVSR